MSLIARRSSPDKVTVILRRMEETPTSRGRKVPVETGRVECWGRLQESSTEDITAYAAAGEAGVLHTRRFYTRSFPGDYLSQVVDAAGRVYEVVGEPKQHRGSRRTARDVVVLKQKGAF